LRQLYRRRRAPHSSHISIRFRQPPLAVLAVEKVLLESIFLFTEIAHRVFFELSFVRMGIELLRHGHHIYVCQLFSHIECV
jgi:hypothetical protein